MLSPCLEDQNTCGDTRLTGN